MSETNDPFEAELASLRPVGPSDELQRRLGERLAPAPSRKRRLLAAFACAGGLAAACVTAVSFFPVGVDHYVGPVLDSAPREDESMPTVQAYRRALARSPEDLEALLDKHAAHAPSHDSQRVEVYAFTRSAEDHRLLLGDR